MNTIIVYTSKTGFTKRYAGWMAEELDCAAVPFSKKAAKGLGRYDLIIYGGGVTAAAINGLAAFKKTRVYTDKKIIVFATGATPAAAASTIEKIHDRNFSEKEKQRIPFFYMQGGINYEQMGFTGRTLLHFMHNLLAKKARRTVEETNMMNMTAASTDASDRSYAAPLVKCIQN